MAAAITPENLSITRTDADFPMDTLALFATSIDLYISPPTLVGSRLLKKEPIRKEEERYPFDIPMPCVSKSICHLAAENQTIKIFMDTEARISGTLTVFKIFQKC